MFDSWLSISSIQPYKSQFLGLLLVNFCLTSKLLKGANVTQDNEEFPFYLSDEDTKFLMDLGEEMFNQDTGSTAQPYGLTVQKKEIIITDEEFADNWTLFSEGAAVAEGLKQAKAYLIDEIHEKPNRCR